MGTAMSDADRERALRKQLLLMRSATERAELVQAVTATRQSTHFFGNGIPGLSMGGGLPLVLGLLKRAPLLSPLLSVLRAGLRRPALRYGLLAAGSAWLAWKGYQWLAERSAAGADSPEEGNPPPGR
jgi:hypothetical protein